MKRTIKALFVWIGIIIAAIAVILLLVFGETAAIEWYYQRQFGNDTVWLLTGNATCLTVLGMLAIELIWIWRILAGKRSHATPIAIGVTCAAISGIVLSTGCYDRFTQDGIEHCRFWRQTVYTWEDIDYFTLSADHDGVLIYELHMKDNTVCAFIGGAFRVVEYESDAFNACFPEGDSDYAVWLTTVLKEEGCTLSLNNLESLQEKLDDDIYDTVAEDIWNIYHETK